MTNCIDLNNLCNLCNSRTNMPTNTLNNDNNINKDDLSNKYKFTKNNHVMNDEFYDEILLNKYHVEKNSGNWQNVKMILSYSYNDKLATEYLWDLLEPLFNSNNDDFTNILRVYYKYELNDSIIYEFEPEIAKHLIDNLKIHKFYEPGYFFNNNINQNKWGFKIVIVTNKNIYSANRYINSHMIGYY